MGADPFKTAFNPLLFSIMQLRGMSVIADHAVMIPLDFYNQEDSRQILSLELSVYNVVGLHNYFIMWFFDTLWALYVSNLSSAVSQNIFTFTASLISYSTKGPFPVNLRDSFSSQYKPRLFQSIMCYTLLFFFCKCCPDGNYDSVTTMPHSVCL